MSVLSSKLLVFVLASFLLVGTTSSVVGYVRAEDLGSDSGGSSSGGDSGSNGSSGGSSDSNSEIFLYSLMQQTQ